MDTNSLKDTLKALHNNLESTDNIDVELKQLLQTLDLDIRQLLDKDAEESKSSSALVERAQKISAKFASEHPHLEPALREVIDILAKMGI
jgi:hypothetical protein